MSVNIQFACLPKLNLAFQQNHVALIRQLDIVSAAEETLTGLTVEVFSEPGFCLPWSQEIEELAPGQTVQLGRHPLMISMQYLAELTERLTASLHVVVKAKGKQIAQVHETIDLMAYDQWTGSGLLPEMLAAFVTPNHPEISAIIRQASASLQQWTGNPSFDEYQSKNPDRVRKQMAAIYQAVASLNLVYCSVPASFEAGGQRVRLADAIIGHKLANCLDISLFYAACLEAVGINPVLIVVDGHAFVGAWLIEETFADSVNDDPSLLSKRTAPGINEMCVIEATCMNAGSTNSFDQAAEIANQRLFNISEFRYFIDVQRARYARIRPLPLRVNNTFVYDESNLFDQGSQAGAAPQDLRQKDQLVYVNNLPVTKQKIWERKLLDLSLRNSLLNIRTGGSVIQFITTSIAAMEDALANGEEFQILPRPTDWDHPLRDTGLQQALNGSSPEAALVAQELKHKRIRTYLNEGELTHQVVKLYRASRLALEENGASTLYIALGLLKWFETPTSEKPRYAPILLVPVEIIRKSAQKGYVIRSREEDTIMNITLLEMLRQDHGLNIALENLPRDESGVDVMMVFNILRQGIMNKARWDVEEQALISTFTFSKFILWSDIHHNTEALCRNKLVASLVSGRLEWQPEPAVGQQEVSDAHLHPGALALPISTDSSQLQAILSASQGRSFVLHGPPGTGKSQTITNIIANALFAGKKVLFVAAKKAALDVVESRLESIGIGAFCLELHSNKAKKTAILEQLKRATEITREAAPAGYQDQAERLHKLRLDLHHYVQALHQVHGFGFSLYDAFARYSTLPAGPCHVNFPGETLARLEPSQLLNWEDQAQQLQAAALLIGQAHQHKLQGIRLKTFTPQLKDQAADLLQQLLQTLKNIDSQGKAVAAILKLPAQPESLARQQQLLQLVNCLQAAPHFPGSLLQLDAIEPALSHLKTVAGHGQARDQLKTRLLARFTHDVLTVPAQQLLADWKAADAQWFLPKWLKQRRLYKELKTRATSADFSSSQVQLVLNEIINYQAEQAFIERETGLPDRLGYLWNQGNCNWAGLSSVCDALIDASRLAGSLLGPEQAASWRKSLGQALADGSAAYLAHYQKELSNWQMQFERLQQLATTAQDLLGIDWPAFEGTENQTLASQINQAAHWFDGLVQLRDWHNYQTARTAAISADLMPLVTAYENNAFASADIVLQYNKGLYRSAANYIISESEALATFNGALFEDKIKMFRQLSRQFELLTRKELYARLAASIPNFAQEAAQSSEIGILQRMIRNNGRATSIRKIFDQVPNLLHKIAPCMLMSPISVAQYFDAKSERFDLVIFDEASQLPTCEAVGAIVRAKTVIVVGDPKQMPPTSFFSTNVVDEDNIEKEDLENILEDCLALSMPSQHLLWHYRSKHESLIAFSNSKYYENKLLTFPSIDDITSKVQLVPVPGYYDKGKTRQNRFEAKAIVDEVVRRLRHPRLSQRSMGIVTFSSVQQTLIEDMLNEVFAAQPELERLALELEEPLFVKNLENVQGDERDVILFSIGYGPDQNGNVSLNFGPLNRDGGWRRLNVAVSRARYEMIVFSTLRPDQIDLNRTSSEGMAGLKAFMTFAEQGKAALPAVAQAKQLAATHSLEEQIAQALRQKGYIVHTHIGSSAYKIDIGIVNPQQPNAYLLGVLTDGYNYHQANTAKDREINQLDVLKMLGWSVHKIWSTDWWENPERVVQGIIEAAEAAASNPVPAEQPVPEQLIEHLLVDAAPEPAYAQAHQSDEDYQAIEAALPALCGQPYVLAQLDRVRSQQYEDFFMPNNRPRIMNQIQQVLKHESPVSRELLCKRVLDAWGIGRMGSKIAAHLDQLIGQLNIKTTRHSGAVYLWAPEHDPASYDIYRTTDDAAAKREADDLPPEEIANAVHDILRSQISLPRQDLAREAARVFGYAQLGSKIKIAMESGIDHAVQRGLARLEGDRVVGN